jgi:hypothetical protein
MTPIIEKQVLRAFGARYARLAKDVLLWEHP